MKNVSASAAAFALMIAPALAQTATSDAASRAAAVATVNGNTTIFEASRSRNNTPDAFASATGGTTDCQYPGFGIGTGQPGFGLGISIPLGTDADCKRESLARFRMRTAEMLMRSNPQEARRNIHAANELLCQISYNASTSMCAQQAVVTYWYCRNPAGYYPAVSSCLRWEAVTAARSGF